MMMGIEDVVALSERVEGIPTSLPLYADDFMVCVLIVCGLILAAVAADRKNFLPRLLRSFFLPRESAVEGVRTTNVLYMRIGMYVLTFFSLGLLLTVCLSNKLQNIANVYTLWTVTTVAIVSFHLLRVALFAMTDYIFLDHPTQVVWEHNYANWTILSGIPLYFLTLIVVFFDLPASVVLLLLGVCVVMLELCLQYKAFYIFSGKKYGILQLFLYLCTLELIPLLMAGKALVLFL